MRRVWSRDGADMYEHACGYLWVERYRKPLDEACPLCDQALRAGNGQQWVIYNSRTDEVMGHYPTRIEAQHAAEELLTVVETVRSRVCKRLNVA